MPGDDVASSTPDPTEATTAPPVSAAPDASPGRRIPWLWRVHDVIVGALAGFGAGAVGGLFAMRLVDTPAMPLTLGAVGATLGVIALFWSRDERGFLNPAVVIAWVVLVLSAGFITLLAVAIANFE